MTSVLIVGGGGLGTVLAAHLARGGAGVTLLVKPAQAAAMADGILQITGLSTFSAAVSVTSTPPEGPFDYLIVCVKARDTEAALAPLARVAAGAVLSLQNGVLKNELLARLFGRDRVLGAITGAGGTLLRPGHALHSLAGATLAGEPDGTISARGERLAEAMRAGGLAAACVPDIARLEWHKLAIFVPGAVLCALTRVDVAETMLHSELVVLRSRVLREAAAVAAAEGFPLTGLPIWLAGGADPAAPVASPDSPEAELITAFRYHGERLRAQGVALFPSLAQDVMAGRPTELEATAGDIARRAGGHGIPVPVLETCVRLLRGAGSTAIPGSA